VRIPTVKPEWLEDEKLGALEDSARLLGIALILLSDDHGRGRAHPLRIAAVLWGYQRDHEAQVRKAREGLASLSRAGYIELYEVRGQSYYLISNWNKHQRVDKPSKPRHPGPDEADPKPPPPRLTSGEPSRDPRETLAPDPDPDPDPDQDLDPDPDPDRSRAGARTREAPREPVPDHSPRPLEEPDRDPDRGSRGRPKRPPPDLTGASGRWAHFERAWCDRFGGKGMGGFDGRRAQQVDAFKNLSPDEWVLEVDAFLAHCAELDPKRFFPDRPWDYMKKHLGQWAAKAQRKAAAERKSSGRRVLDDEIQREAAGEAPTIEITPEEREELAALQAQAQKAIDRITRGQS